MHRFLPQAFGNITRNKMSVVVATATKETPTSKVGLSLKVIKGKKIITGISEDSIFYNSDTDLQVGYELLGINGINLANLDVPDVVAILKAAESEVTLQAQQTPGYVSASVMKPSRDCKLGIGVIEREGQIYITSIAPDGLFGGSDLVEGYRVVTVNRQPLAGLSSMDAVARFKGAPSALTVLAEDPGYITVTVTKDTPGAKCGINVKNVDGTILVTNINPTGLFADTELKAGMKIVRVNKKEAAGLATTDAMKLFKQAKGEVTVTAEYVGYVGVTVYKEKKDAKVGIKVKEKDGNIYVSSIGEDSLFAGTDLKVGMKILTVNKNEVTGLTPFEAIDFFKSAEGVVQVFAEEFEEPPAPAAPVEED